MLYINKDLANLNMQETVRKLVPESDANLKALSQSITRFLTAVKDMKKHLNRTWDKLISYMKFYSAVEFIQSFTCIVFATLY